MSNGDLFRIVYNSLALLIPGAAADFELQRILEVSQARNLGAGITGALRCDRVYFLQVLEGPRAAVVSTMARIQRDSRHTRIRILEAAPLARRDFADWSMTLVPERNVAMARLSNPDLIDIQPATAAQAVGSLRALLAAHRGA